MSDATNGDSAKDQCYKSRLEFIRHDPIKGDASGTTLGFHNRYLRNERTTLDESMDFSDGASSSSYPGS